MWPLVSYTALTRLWGNEEFTASPHFLKNMVECCADADEGTRILECGSGLSTLCLSLVAPGRVVSLEHDRAWHARTMRNVSSSDVDVRLRPLRSYKDEWGSFDWYDVRPEEFDGMRFSVVVVDGPPGHVSGGRYGVIPVMLRFLYREFTLILDDTHRLWERELPDVWSSRYGVRWVDRIPVPSTLDRSHTILRGVVA